MSVGSIFSGGVAVSLSEGVKNVIREANVGVKVWANIVREAAAWLLTVY
jgi:hypothetical protein